MLLDVILSIGNKALIVLFFNEVIPDLFRPCT